jgi:5'-nucleotidase (lipoprotein e(P4) family)
MENCSGAFEKEKIIFIHHYLISLYMKYSLLLIVIVVASCSTNKQTSITKSSGSGSITIDGKLFAALYQQYASEYRALCYQAYNIARLRLDQQLQQSRTRPKAIITDVDETLLDNSANTVHQSLLGNDFNQASWYDWTSRSNADTVPGALNFLKYASSNGVSIYYITNRDEKERAATVQNLKKFNFPDADDIHLLPKQESSSKEIRRQQVMKDYDVVLLLGDNLGDFSDLFDKRSVEVRIDNTNKVATLFGNRFIVLPNPVYGDWETALYHYNYNYTSRQKDSVIRSLLKGY